MELETQNKYFDRQYFLHNESINFNSLTTFAIVNKFVDEGHMELVIDTYKDAIYNLIMANYDFDLEDDYETTLTELTNKYFLALNDYLKTFESPYSALNEIMKNSPKVIICNSYDRYNYFENELNKKLSELNSKSKLLCEKNFEYSQFIKTINNYQALLGSKQLLYPTLDNNSVKDMTSLEVSCNVLDDYILETNIVNKFNQREILILLKKIMYSEDYKGISTVAMYNYIFNYFFKDSTSIVITENMCQIIVESIKNKLISSNDVMDIIQNGGIKYNEEEQKYIINKFVPAFQNEIIEKKNYIPFVKIK